MADSGWRVGSYYFPQGQEPSRWDIAYTSLSDPKKFKYYNISGSLFYGLRPTSYVLQGYLNSYDEIEGLLAEYKKSEEVIIDAERFDNTNAKRRFRGIPGGTGKETGSGKRKKIYDYLLEFMCPDPFAYQSGDIPQYVYDAIDGANVQIALVTAFGKVWGEAQFILRNESGGNVTNLTVGDGGTSTSGSYITVLGTLADDHEWLIYPIKWRQNPYNYGVGGYYEIYTVWDRDFSGVADPTSEDHDIQLYNWRTDSALAAGTGNLTFVGIATGDMPRIEAASEVFHASVATGAHASLLLITQYRKRY